MNRKLRIVKVPADKKFLDGRGQFPWLTYWEVFDGDRYLATVSTCNDLDKGVHACNGRLTRDEHVAVARALNVSANL